MALFLVGCGGNVGDSPSAVSTQTTPASVPPTPSGHGNSAAPTSSPAQLMATQPTVVAPPSSGPGTSAALTSFPAQPMAMQPVAVAPPPMGWSSWNSLGENVNYNAIKAAADGLASLNAKIPSGNKYQYVNIDEGWWTSGLRDSNGNFVINVASDGKTPNTQWPGGMQAMTDYIHSKGLKAGIYIDAGPTGCGQRDNGTPFIGSDYDHYNSDFLQFAQWGFDFVKVDFCGGSAAGYDPQDAYTKISSAIQAAFTKTGHRLYFSICDWGDTPSESEVSNGKQVYPPGNPYHDVGYGPWVWGAGVGNSWRTTDDILTGNTAPSFSMMVANLVGNYHPESQHTGSYNDPDMMIAGMGMPFSNDQAHVSLWAVSGAPMILGNNLSGPLSRATEGLLTNPDVISIDQDPLGLQGILVYAFGSTQIWAKLLTGSGRRAVVLFNQSSMALPMTVTWQQLGLNPSSPAQLQSVWSQQSLGTFTGSYTAPAVPAGGAVMLVVNGTDQAATMYTPSAQSGENGPVTFTNIQSGNRGGFIQLAYSNETEQPIVAQLATNSSPSTSVSLPPTGESGGLITLFVPLTVGQNSISVQPGSSATKILSLNQVAGPIDSSRPVSIFTAGTDIQLAGGALQMACGACSGGTGVVLGTNGTVTINNISAPQAGRYEIRIYYTNPDRDTSPRLSSLTVNGNDYGQIQLPRTGGNWNVWYTPVVVQLNEGASNSITLNGETSSNWWSNFDSDLTFNPASMVRPPFMFVRTSTSVRLNQ
ncbi:alpha-galactosidase [Caballeronia sp. LZ065]|uniref:alpha-galactosidase D n=1 Tax=Caballeronia sp. LZ065 TaxID=3038571 RepID=UPI002860DD50|nr:alpha-galactosidase [Caballeronia sp. LZ065]MDR5781325.1 alpha-galactosidase [Caballeronia sp. LZ065]